MSATRHPSKEQTAVGPLLHAWASFVRRVETGYALSIYDYTNDLSTRDLLEEALPNLPLAEGEASRARLSEWDLRYEQATRPSVRPLAPGIQDGARAWWFRIPLRLGGELESDLRDEGLIP